MYKRREVVDHVTVMNKELYDNLQDGIDESIEHKEHIATDEVGAHNFRYYNNVFQYYNTVEKEWLDINLEKIVTNTAVLQSIGNDVTTLGVGMFKLEEETLDINEYVQDVLYPELSVGMHTFIADPDGSQRFVLVSKTDETLGAYLIFGYNQELQQYKLVDSEWSLFITEVGKHKNLVITDETGVHNLRYKDDALQVCIDGVWSNIVMPTTDLTKEDVDDIMDDLEINYDSENGNIDGVTKLQQAIDVVNDDLQDTKEDVSNVQGAIDEVSRTLGYTVGSKKNLLNNTLGAQSTNGLTFTINNDRSVTVNGKASAGTSLKLCEMTLNAGNYILSGCPEGASGYYMVVTVDGKSYVDSGNGVTIPITSTTTVKPNIVVLDGYTVSNKTFKPMIRLASIEDDTYEPYVEDLDTRLQHYDYLDITSKISKSSNCHSINYAYVKNGNVHIGGFISTSAVTTSSTWLFAINDVKYSPIHKVWGRFSYSTSSDFDKIVNINIENNTGYVVLLNTLSNVVAFEFSYPIK